MVAAGIGCDRTNKERVNDGFELLAVGEELLIRRQLNVRGQRVEPVFGTIELIQRLHALAAAGQKVLEIIRVVAGGQAPLTGGAPPFGGTGLCFCPPSNGQQKDPPPTPKGGQHEGGRKRGKPPMAGAP